MNNFRRICNSVEGCDEYRRFNKPCDSCNTRRALKYHHIIRDKILERSKITILLRKNILLNIIKSEKAKCLI